MQSMSEFITPRQIKALKALNALSAPTMEEWARKMGVSYSTITHYRRALQDRKLITKDPGRSRSLRLTEAGLAAIAKRKK